MDNLDFEVDLNPKSDEQSKIRDGIISFNQSIINDKPICFNIYVRQNKSIVGGAIIYGHKDAYYIDVLWVDDAHRHQGIGSKIMSLVEETANKKGIFKLFVDTYDFQAQDFYKKHGFQSIGIVPKYLLDHDRVFMRKELQK